MKPNTKLWQMTVALLLCLVVLAGCGGDDSESGEDDTNTNPSPEQQANVPEGVQELEVVIENGEIDVDTLNLQVTEPAMLHVDNRDDTAYLVEIMPDLVTSTDVAASQVTDVSFTVPNVNDYTLEIRAADGNGDPLDTVQVLVQSPSGDT
jgi:hypothetical protein